MALSGTLKSFNVLQLLALVDKTGKTGSLLLEHWGQSVTVFFEDGKVTHVKDHPLDLATALLHAGKIDPEQHSLLSPGLSEMAVAETLSSRGIMSLSEVIELAQGRILEILCPLFTWTDGTFRMELNTRPDEGDILGSVDLGTALSRVRSRVAEFQKLVAAIPSLDAPLTLMPEAPPSGQVCLSADEWRLVAATTGLVPLRDLAQKLGADELEIRKVTQRLISSGLAILAAAGPEEPATEVQPAPPAPGKAQSAPVAPFPEPPSAPATPVQDPPPDPGLPVQGPQPASAEPPSESPGERVQTGRSGGLMGFFKLR